MITLIHKYYKELTQKIYDKLIKHLFNDRVFIKSPCCENGILKKHSYYVRCYKSCNGKDVVELRVLRVKCSAFGKTHAILPMELIPYAQTGNDIVMKVLSGYQKFRLSHNYQYRYGNKFQITGHNFINRILSCQVCYLLKCIQKALFRKNNVKFRNYFPIPQLQSASFSPARFLSIQGIKIK